MYSLIFSLCFDPEFMKTMFFFHGCLVTFFFIYSILFSSLLFDTFLLVDVSPHFLFIYSTFFSFSLFFSFSPPTFFVHFCFSCHNQIVFSKNFILHFVSHFFPLFFSPSTFFCHFGSRFKRHIVFACVAFSPFVTFALS